MDIELAEVIRLVYIGICETVIVHLSLTWLMGPSRRTRSLPYAGMLSCYFVATIIDAANDLPPYYVFVIAYVLVTITAYFFFEGTLAVKFSLPFVCMALDYAATIVATLLVCKIRGTGIDGFPPNLRQGVTSQTLLTIICLSLVLAISFWGKWSSAKGSPATTWLALLVTEIAVPLAIFVLLLRQFYINQATHTPQTELRGHLIVTALLLLSAFTLYSLTMLYGSLSESLSYSATLEQMLGMQEQYYKDLQEHQFELRRINHDIKNHTRSISELLKQGRYDDASSYVENLNESISSVTAPVTSCDNQLIAAMLNDKLGETKRQGVKLSLCVMVPPILRINNVDMCILLGNLLDNAVEACSRMSAQTDRFIDVDIRLKGMFLSVDIANSYSGLLNVNGGRYLTTKLKQESHGLGISNAERITEKYEGRLTFTHDDTTFRAVAILRYPDE